MSTHPATAQPAGGTGGAGAVGAGPGGSPGAVPAARPGGFRAWKASRPFWGATISLIAGFLILWMPLNLFPFAFLPDTLIFLGYLFSGLVIATAIAGYLLPAASTYLGILVILFSIVSIFGALGGLFVGAILGILGGSLMVAWQPAPLTPAMLNGQAHGTGGTGPGTGAAGPASSAAARRRRGRRHPAAPAAEASFHATELVSEEEIRQRPWLRYYPAGVRPHLNYPDIPLHRLLERAAEMRPRHPVIHFFGRTMRYGELNQLANRFARVLANLGIRPGDRVALMMPNCPQFVIAYYGALKAGAVVVNCNPLYSPRELEFQLNDSGARVIVALDLMYPTVRQVVHATPVERVLVTRINEFMSPLLRRLYPLKAKRDGSWVTIGREEGVLWFTRLLKEAPAVPPPVQVGPEDLALLQYTGGTTGTAKGAMLTHRNLVANVLQTAEWTLRGRWDEAHQQVILGVMPFFHSYGMTTVMNLAIALQCTMVPLPRFEAEMVIKAIAKYRPTMVPGVPTMYVALMNHPKFHKIDVSSIEACVSGAAPLPLEVQERFEASTGGQLVEGYGLTEASPVTHANPPDANKRNGTIGLPVPDTEARIVDIETGTQVLGPGEVGELIIRGPQVMKGYWNRPEETARTLRDGWLYTGDIATMDEDGFFRIVDRKKEMIISGGYNVYPREVEEVLYEHPKVLEAAVIGAPDPYRGEMVKAFVVLKPGQTATEQEIIEFCRQRLAKYKVPRAVEFRSELPKTLIGKVLRRALLEEERKKQAAGATAAPAGASRAPGGGATAAAEPEDAPEAEPAGEAVRAAGAAGVAGATGNPKGATGAGTAGSSRASGADEPAGGTGGGAPSGLQPPALEPAAGPHGGETAGRAGAAPRAGDPPARVVTPQELWQTGGPGRDGEDGGEGDWRKWFR
ncbi:long-chain-fatty-acid--CoA ligase [Thermaerobacter litoralis]